MSDYVLTVHGSEWLNANDRGHWRRRAKLSKEWREATGWKAKLIAIGPPFERIRIVATVLVPDARRRDPSNYAPTAKACVDGIVDAGLIRDDDAKHLDGPDMRLRIERALPAGLPTLELGIEVLA